MADSALDTALAPAITCAVLEADGNASAEGGGTMREIRALVLAAGLCSSSLVAAGDAASRPASRPAQDALEITAFTTPVEELDIASEIAGVLSAVPVQEGQTVRKGDVLVNLKDDLYLAQLKVSQSRVDAAAVEIAAAKKTHETRSQEHERAKKLFDQKVMSADDYGKAKLEMDVAELGIRKAEAEKKVYELNAARDDEALKQTIIRAPRDGEILRILKHPGEAVQEHAPVLKMVCTDPLYVIAYVPIGAAAGIKVGAEATVRLETGLDRPLRCTVTVVDPVADAASGTCRVKLTLPNPTRTHVSGSKGTVKFGA